MYAFCTVFELLKRNRKEIANNRNWFCEVISCWFLKSYYLKWSLLAVQSWAVCVSFQFIQDCRRKIVVEGISRQATGVQQALPAITQTASPRLLCSTEERRRLLHCGRVCISWPWSAVYCWWQQDLRWILQCSTSAWCIVSCLVRLLCNHWWG